MDYWFVPLAQSKCGKAKFSSAFNHLHRIFFQCAAKVSNRR